MAENQKFAIPAVPETEEKRTALIRSWNSQEQLYELTRWYRNKELVMGVVRSFIEREHHKETLDKQELRPIQNEGSETDKEDAVLVVALPNGMTGYCKASKYSTYNYLRLRTQVGREAYFYVDEIDLDTGIVLLNGKQAQEDRQQLFLAELEKYEAEGTLSEHTFEAIVTGKRRDGYGIYVSINGYSCFMQRREWSWNERDAVYVSEGEKINVRIKRFSYEEATDDNGVKYQRANVLVSRRDTLPDPYTFITMLKQGQMIAGKVSKVDPVHGIWVTLEMGLDVKASILNALPNPELGDMVSCVVIKEIKRSSRGKVEGRVRILGYPQGKRSISDPGSFLFSKGN